MKSEEERKDLLLEPYSSTSWRGEDILLFKLYVGWERIYSKVFGLKKLIKFFFRLSLSFFLVESKGSRNKIYLVETQKLSYSVREKRLYGRNKWKEKN